MSALHTTHTDVEYEMPSAEALLASTLALMTGHAQSKCMRQRCLMSRKITSNLLTLSHHAMLSANFRAVVDRMRPHWMVLAQGFDDTLPAASALSPTVPQTLWHATGVSVQ